MRETHVPDFLITLSEQMNSQSNRCTAHPFWQVRTKEFAVTAQGYNEHHWEIISEDGVTIFRSDTDPLAEIAKCIKEHHSDDINDIEMFAEAFDPDFDELPDELRLCYVQEVEKVVSTHLTEVDAQQFIERCQHNYNTKLYTYVESAYWAPQFRQLQDWIKSLTSDVEAKN